MTTTASTTRDRSVRSSPHRYRHRTRWVVSPRRVGHRSDRGATVVEVALLTPALLILLLLAVGLGRLAHARQQVEGAARDAARAASLERAPGRAQAAGVQAAHLTLTQAGISCQQLQVVVDVSANHPGGQVRATVTCTVSMTGLSPAGLHTMRVSDTAIVPIEIHRSTP